MTYEIFKDRNKQFRFRLRARNGHITAQSEGYKSKTNAKKLFLALQSIILDGRTDAIKFKDLTLNSNKLKP